MFKSGTARNKSLFAENLGFDARANRKYTGLIMSRSVNAAGFKTHTTTTESSDVRT